REYDGTRDAEVDFSNLTLGGLVTGDDFVLAGTGVFADSNAGINKNVALTLTASGGDVNNYTFTLPTTTTGTIDKRVLDISGVIANDKVYDGSTMATFDFSN
ncbi:YDG domain-containing protein, partial [Arthrospira platensis SPKY1]|nr:YDG domain-containing protein [Arthrospira platensis SPKY1]